MRSSPSTTSFDDSASFPSGEGGEPRERPIVAIQGELGSFSNEAVARYWNGAGTALPQIDCARVTAAVIAGRATHGLLPVENSIAGRVEEAHAALAAASELEVVGEIVLPIAQCLMAPPGATLDSVRTVYSHPVALRQCARFFDERPHLRAHEAYDTAGAARDVAARGRWCDAAIAGRGAAARYGLSLLAEDIGDRGDNETRFWIVARRRDHATTATPRRREAMLGAVRGATTVPADDTLLIHEATSELLAQLLNRNALCPDQVISAIFTVTPDLRSEFPARAARDLGLHEVPMLCAVEMTVPGALARCIRVLLHVAGPLPSSRGQSVYLREAATLRPDLMRNSTAAAVGSG